MKSKLWGGVLMAVCLMADFKLSAEPATGPLRPLPLNQVEIRDSFWAPRLQIYREQTIPHSWFYMQWELRALRAAGGQKVDGELNGTWGEANLYKFMETVANALAIAPDPALEQRLDEIIKLLAAAQQPSGYLHAYVTNSKKQPWDPDFLDGSHDGYVLGHMIEAALAHHAATGKRNFLDLARKAADEACNHFLGPNGHPGFCGHAELEMALADLYRATHEKRYLELSQAFVEWRGRGVVKPFSETPRAYFQDGAPVRAQRTLEGHAVRAVFFATGVADLALETGNADYRLAANRFWDSTAHRRMAITGGIGPRKEHEAFGEDYELPNDGYYESCAACGLANFAQRMFFLERQAESADVMERVLYNAILHGISLDGTNTYYCNPLSDTNHLRDNCWVCCPPNLSRTLLQIGRYAYAASPRELYVNLFIGGVAHANLDGKKVTLRVETDYPWDGQVKIKVETESPTRFALHVRRPGWCQQAALQLNGTASPNQTDDAGFWAFEREWQSGDTVKLRLDMPVRRMLAHPAIAACRGKVAVQRGPLVYAFEGLDNAGNAQVTLGSEPAFQVERRPELLGGVTVIRGVNSQGQSIQAVPFYTLANRGKSTQEVWPVQEGWKLTDAWWLGALYLPRPE